MEIKGKKARAMTFPEFEKYTDFLAEHETEEKEELETAKDSAALKAKNRNAKWIMKEIYGIDTATLDCSWMTVIKFVDETERLSMKSEGEDEKNLLTSGNGELKAE